MKKLKFAHHLIEKVLNKQKDTTWRVDDEKDLLVNDLLSLRTNENEEFAQAKVIWVKQTTFENLTKEDAEGHEKFTSQKEMYETYKKYYNKEITPQTQVKVIKFKLF